MSKCLKCGKENEGVVCSHCLAKTTSSIGNFVKKAGALALAIVPIVTPFILNKNKGNTDV